MRVFLSFFMVFVAPVSAHAHLGHVGELAGHGHLIGIAAGVAAAVLAALIAKNHLSDKEDEEATDDGEPETEPETAGA